MNPILLILILQLSSMVICDRHHHRQVFNGTELFQMYEHKRPDETRCNLNNCPYTRGVCTMKSECFCFNGYLTVNVDDPCSYKQKSKVLFILLESIISFGSGHFYAERYLFGCIKLGFCIAIFSVYCFCHALKNTVEAHRKEALIRLGLILIFSIWQVIDAIFIGMGYYLDGKDLPFDEL